jgi:hypothetical protein
MFKPRDNIGSDAVALPRRNIFAPPVPTAPQPRARAGGVFDAAAACGPETLTSKLDAEDASTRVVSRRSAARFVVALWLLAGATAVALAVVLLGASGHSAGTRHAPRQRPADATPRHRADGPREDRKRPAPAHRGRPARRRTDRPRPRLHRRPRPVTTPRPRLVSPPAPQRAPIPAPAEPRPVPGPTRVPPGSPPEFM